MTTYASVAILVDGDNIASSYAGQILRKTSDLGPPRIRRVFCNQQSLLQWKSAHSFLAVHAGAKENGSDILLSVQAMRFALINGIEAFAIATGDRDFSHIAHELRELGRHVIGLGNSEAGKDFRFACTSFLELKPPAAKIATEELGEIDKALRKAFESEDPEGKGIPLNRINPLVRKHIPDLKISDEPAKTWPKYFSEDRNLYTVTGEGQDRRVYITRNTE